MITDTTLAAWADLQMDPECDHRACARLETALDEAVAEIRRLLRAGTAVTHLDAIRVRLDSLSVKKFTIEKRDVAWLVDTVDILAACRHGDEARCGCRARLEEPDA